MKSRSLQVILSISISSASPYIPLMRVAVVGAGISGLASTYVLVKAES
ncbi:hypothetical protein M8C21_002668 [Ambrosia artemisiifolia]|uniref:Uncharacterized protein n=1 Tax=Ambrosia artemisiifolia TaxID=4212 RepID=A0AAD5BTZ3_AMBAR|nr:hypothetical protein M8C21_002668 [Ambrosia artemisiifolia]